MLLKPENASPRATATVELLSKVFRPFNFLVTVKGEPPHEVIRRYRVAAPTDNDAALTGLQEFEKEFMRKIQLDGLAPVAPKAKFI